MVDMYDCLCLGCDSFLHVRAMGREVLKFCSQILENKLKSKKDIFKLIELCSSCLMFSSYNLMTQKIFLGFCFSKS